MWFILLCMQLIYPKNHWFLLRWVYLFSRWTICCCDIFCALDMKWIWFQRLVPKKLLSESTKHFNAYWMLKIPLRIEKTHQNLHNVLVKLCPPHLPLLQHIDIILNSNILWIQINNTHVNCLRQSCFKVTSLCTNRLQLSIKLQILSILNPYHLSVLYIITYFTPCATSSKLP